MDKKFSKLPLRKGVGMVLLNNNNQVFGSGIVVPDVKVDTKTLLTG